MGKYFRKARGFISSLWKNFRTDCTFSFRYALLRAIAVVGGKIGLRKLSQLAQTRRDKWIQAYLSKQLNTIVSKYLKDFENGNQPYNAPVWICWWSGIDAAPDLVKRCIESSYKNAGTHPVHLITKDTYSKYLQIPEYMLRKVNTGKMGLAHLADYIRVKLLASYGGLWLDATIFSSQQIPESYFELPVFTMKGPVQECGYVSKMRWVTFCLGGWEGNVFYRFLTDAFEHYWQRCDYAVDYLFFDHIILLAYTQLPTLRKLIDDIPDNNIHRDDLQAAMNAVLPASEFENVIQPDTTLYKLSWRESYAETTKSGETSIYGFFLNL